MSIWYNFDRPFVLASCSPRRRQILQEMGFTFDCRAPQIENENDYLHCGQLHLSLQRLALAKAESVAATMPQSVVLGADTVVVIDGDIMGKPADRAEAASMLNRLVGRMHRVYTACALVCIQNGFCQTKCAVTDVYMRRVSDEEIDAYLQTEEYADKAGAYAIQGRGMVLIDKICGCFYNVMGLPLTETITLCKEYAAMRG
ncbi:MAG: septum formation protein Maf [Chitinivibrionales bacterium]|nr:septum formation protein Maf [Chitinivibrionales bacterium]